MSKSFEPWFCILKTKSLRSKTSTSDMSCRTKRPLACPRGSYLVSAHEWKHRVHLRCSTVRSWETPACSPEAEEYQRKASSFPQRGHVLLTLEASLPESSRTYIGSDSTGLIFLTSVRLVLARTRLPHFRHRKPLFVVFIREPHLSQNFMSPPLHV